MSKCHIVLVTYNRSDLLKENLLQLIKQPQELLERIWLVNNASQDDTIDVVEKIKSLDKRVECICLPTNIGGAGGFSYGLKKAFQAGAEWIGLMDDDLILAPDALYELNKQFNMHDCLAVVRQNLRGKLEEFAAIKYDLRNPFRINPKIVSVVDRYHCRENLPENLVIDCASFEGLFIRRKVVEEVGFPNEEYFIYGDDFDYCIRIRRKGFSIYLLKNAVGVRQLPYSRSRFSSWKAYYVWRNFFILHFLYGENFFVRVKPYILYMFLRVLCHFVKMSFDPRKLIRDAILISRKIKNKTC